MFLFLLPVRKAYLRLSNISKDIEIGVKIFVYFHIFFYLCTPFSKNCIKK